MWIWYVSKSEGGNIGSIVARAKQNGIGTLIIKASDGGSPFIGQFTPQLVAAFHAQGIKVCGYSYVYGNNPAAEAAQGAAVAQTGADCLVIDAEGEYEGKYAAATTYIRDLRQAVGDSFPVAIAPFPYADFHQSFPYSVFLGPGGAQYDLPQMYWKDIGDSVDAAFDHTYTWHRIYDRPIYPLGQTYSSPSPNDIVRFRQLAQAYGAGGISWWDWQETGVSQWAAVGQALPPLERLRAHEQLAGAEAGLVRRRGGVAADAPPRGRPAGHGQRQVRRRHRQRGARAADQRGAPGDRGHGPGDVGEGAELRADRGRLDPAGQARPRGQLRARRARRQDFRQAALEQPVPSMAWLAWCARAVGRKDPRARASA